MSTTTLPTTARNILKFYRSIPADVIAEGREWYPRARALAEELAAQYEPRDYFADGEDSWKPGAVERAAAVIAVLSPRLNWSKNVQLAKLAYENYYSDAGFVLEDRLYDWPGLKANARKAFRILDGEDPEDVVQGEKVRPFWRTIVDPTDPRAVVIDRHALDVAVGRVLTDEQRGELLGRKGAYDQVSDLYRRAAKHLSKASYEWDGPAQTITPAEVQAITWTHWRRTHAATAKANRKTEGK